MKKYALLITLFFMSFLSVACSKDDIMEDLTEEKLSFSVNTSLFAENSKNNQSVASYGDYLIIIPRGRGAMHLYNLRKKTLLYSLKMKAGTGKDVLGSDLYHCNQATFGVDFYEDGDPFPLLYISQRAREDNRCFTEVYRIFPRLCDGDYISMEAQLVQTIFFPKMTYENSLGNVNCVIDCETKEMYTYSRNNNKGDTNFGVCKITSFSIPDFHRDTVMLEDSDILKSYMLECSAINMQGGCIKDGILYIGQGFSSAGIYLNIIDLKKRKLIQRIDLLNDYGIKWEPEGCFYYNNNVMIAEGTNIWQIELTPLNK